MSPTSRNQITIRGRHLNPYPFVRPPLMFMKRVLVIAVLLNLGCVTCLAFDAAPANSTLAVDESFDELGELKKPWHINTGKWTQVDGVLRAAEVKADKHSAAARRIIETGNAVYQFRFRFVDQGKAFHFGFDPKRGELAKKGHLFSVVVTPNSWKIMKHLDKNRPKEEPNENLAQAKTDFQKDQWYTLRVTTWENHVTAKIDGKDELKASHSTFAVRKPTLVFRCIGDGVEIDDIKVWKQNQ